MQRIILLLAVSALSFAQPWSGILDTTRAVDWSTVGNTTVSQGAALPSDSFTQSGSTIAAYTGTAATINTAITNCGTNQYVLLGTGVFTLSTGITHHKSNCVLRGSGATNTVLKINGSVTGGGLGANRAVDFASGASGVGHGPADGFPAPSHIATWSAGYSQGTTVITLSTTTGITAGAVGVGTLLMLDQLDDASDGWPATGDIFSCAGTANNCSNQGGNNYAEAGRAQVQVVTATAINGSNVTITPAIAYPNFRSGQSPQAYWLNGSPLTNAGIENLTIDYSGGTSGMYLMNAANVWVKGNRFINNTSGTGESYGLFTLQSAHVTVRGNYFYGRPGDSCGNFPLANYIYSDQQVSDTVVENNIFHTNVDAMMPNDPAGRNVFAYNYVDNSYIGVAGSQMHSGNVMMDLWEGNNMESFMGDVTHGSHHFNTLFRNHFDGTAHNTSCTTGFAMGILTNNRFFNALGNVIGSTSYTSYETTLNTNNANSVFNLGWNGNNSGATVTTDTRVKATFMRFGNWDMFTSSSRTASNDQTGIRWCGNSGNTGWSTTCSSTSEVPTGITNFSNAVPGAETLPSSFYLSSSPSWWTTPYGVPAFPPIGPDVSSGDAPNISATPTGGHANKIPARLCFENATNDAAYGSSSPRIKAFDADTCYPGATVAPLISGPVGSKIVFGSQIKH